MERQSYLSRTTREVDIRCYLNIDRPQSQEPYQPPQAGAKALAPGVEQRSKFAGEYGFWFPTSSHWIEQIGLHGRFDHESEDEKSLGCGGFTRHGSALVLAVSPSFRSRPSFRAVR